MTEIYLVRHGQTVANRDLVVSGHLDTPLTELGRDQAREAREALGHVSFDAIYSSDLQRAVETAAIVAGREVPESNRHPQMRERHFGALEGGPSERWRELHEDHAARLSSDEQWKARYLPDIESDEDINKRFMTALTEIVRQHDGQTVLVVIHGGLIRTTLVGLGYVKQQQLKSSAFRNGGHVKLHFDGQIYSVEHVDGLTAGPAVE